MASEMTMVLRYVRNLGLYAGLIVFFKVEILKRKRLKIPFYPHPIHLRPFSTDVKVFREIFLFRSYLYDVTPSPCIIVDAGANTGLSSVFFACRFPDATVYAIEPEKSNFNCLLKNIERYENITPVQTALWSRDTVLKIHDQNEDQWAFTVEECNHHDSGSFTAMSLTSLMQRYQINQIDLLKLDIEGAEKEVFLENCDYWLMRTKVIIIELHDWIKPGCSSAFFRTISRYKIKTQVFRGMLVVELVP